MDSPPPPTPRLSPAPSISLAVSTVGLPATPPSSIPTPADSLLPAVSPVGQPPSPQSETTSSSSPSPSASPTQSEMPASSLLPAVSPVGQPPSFHSPTTSSTSPSPSTSPAQPDIPATPVFRTPPTPPPIEKLPTSWQEVLCRKCRRYAHDISYRHCIECHFKENGYPSYYYDM